MSRFRTFFKLPVKEKLLFFKALFWLYSAKVILLFLPLSKCLKLAALDDNSNNINIKTLEYIRTALKRADNLAFWKNRCLVKSFAGKLMLKQLGIKSIISFGVTYTNNKKLVAHAWLKVGDFEVVESEKSFMEMISD